VRRIVVGRALVFASRLAEVFLFEQQIGQLIVDDRRLCVFGE
jgi:hypothetical protein